MSDTYMRDEVDASTTSRLFLPPPGRARWMLLEDFARWYDDGPSTTRIGTWQGTDALRSKLYESAFYLPASRLRQHILISGASDRRIASHVLAWFLLERRREQASFVVFSPAPVLENRLAGELSKTHSIFHLDPDSHEQGLPYNPLVHIPLIDTSTAQKQERSTARQEQAAMLLAETWVLNTLPDNDNEPLRQAVQQALYACVLHLRASNPHSGLSDLRESLCGGADHLAFLEQSPSASARAVYLFHLSSLIHGPAAGDFRSSCIACASFMPTASIDFTARGNALDFSALLRQPSVLFYNSYEHIDGARKPFTALFLAQMLLAFMHAHEDWEQENLSLPPEQRAPELQDIRCLLDLYELCGYVPPLVKDLSLLSRYRVAIIADGSGDAPAHPQELATWNALFHQAATHLLLPGGSEPNRTLYSELCGTVTHGEQTYRLATPSALAINQGTVLGAFLFWDKGPPMLIELQNAFDERSPEKTALLDLPYTTNVGFCADEATELLDIVDEP